MNWYKTNKIAQENGEEVGYLAVTEDFKLHFFSPDAAIPSELGGGRIIAKGLYNIMGNKSYLYLARLFDKLNLPDEVRRKANMQLIEAIADFLPNLKITYVEERDLKAHSGRMTKKARRGFPLIDDRSYDPYAKTKPGDQNGGESGTTYLTTPGSTGLGTDDTFTKGPKGVDIGRGRDTERSEMLDLMSDTDGVDPTKSNDGRINNDTEYGLGHGEKGWEPWYDDTFPENSDKYDEHPSMLSRMNGVQSPLQRSVYDELVSRRKKR